MKLMLLYVMLGSLSLYLINLLFIKLNFLVEDETNNSHRKILAIKNKKVQSGGFFLLITFLLTLSNTNINLILALILIFFLGIFSDVDLIRSPKIRILLQLMIITFLTLYGSVLIEETRIVILDNFIHNKIFSSLFTIFCFLILINGCNFIDGANNLLVGYFLILSLCIFSLTHFTKINFSQNNFEFIILCLLIIFLFNFFSKIIMGDSGAYLIGLFFGFLLINLSNNNESISPIYVLNLLWYPAFENLFSILRKKKKNISVSFADNYHLHHLVFKKLNKKFKNNRFNNSLTGIIINIFNLITISLATIMADHSAKLTMILIFNIIIYLLAYYLLSKKNDI
jgi:UDP-N-acetylmuramyl pentapeptide phosphotransferase/UDP-N-acetylglucosamine-1-phosphate transferase